MGRTTYGCTSGTGLMGERINEYGPSKMSLSEPVETIQQPTPAVAALRDLRKTGIHPDHWYPLAGSCDVKRGKPFGTQFAGEPIVIVRTTSGTLFALEDRCAHRQVPLSGGTVEGELLQCGYHCWTYDASGACVSVPYLDKERTLPNGVRRYPCREGYGLIFVFTGDEAKVTTAMFPVVPGCPRLRRPPLQDTDPRPPHRVPLLVHA